MIDGSALTAIKFHMRAVAHICPVSFHSGAIQEPYLKLIRLMRSLELQTSPESPYIRFGEDIQDMIGQEAHKLPNVFSFFKPEYTPAGGLSSAGLVSPEAQGEFIFLAPNTWSSL